MSNNWYVQNNISIPSEIGIGIYSEEGSGLLINNQVGIILYTIPAKINYNKLSLDYIAILRLLHSNTVITNITNMFKK